MNQIELTFLGTGTSKGVPPIGCNDPVCLSHNPKDKRLRVSILMSYKNRNIVIDCGPDFRQQMLRERVQELSAILFTHEHQDHVAGLDDIRPLVFKQNMDLPIYSNISTLEALKTRFPYVFDLDHNYSGKPRVKPHIIRDKAFEVDGFEIQKIDVLHGKLPILGYLIQNRIGYITDASFISEKEKEKLKNLDVLVINALRKEPKHFSHFVLDQSLKIIEEMNPKRAFLTHISHDMGFHDEVEKELPNHVSLAYDGLKVFVSL